MTLYTIEAHGRPVVVEWMESRSLWDSGDYRAAYLDGWLRRQYLYGQPVWDGDPAALTLRVARPDEAALYQASVLAAIKEGDDEQDAGEMSCLLVASVTATTTEAGRA